MIETFRPLLDAAHGLDLAQPAVCVRELNSRLDPRGPKALALNAALKELLGAGAIANRGAPPVRYGRVCKASPETQNFSIDVVHMSGAGPRHKHPAGEVNYCIALEGSPTFVGRPAGWVVEAPGSEHVPSVEAGTMLIVYLLPGGAIEFQTS